MSDGSMIFLATSIYCDRNKKHFPDGIDPDINIESTDEEDLVLNAALDWIRGN